MLKEEKILRTKFGTDNHFSVPEGYFDSFAEKLMDRIPAPEPRVIEMHAASWWSRLPMRKIAVAASVVAVIGCGSLFFAHQQVGTQGAIAHANIQNTVVSGNEYGSFDEMADYAMIDNQDIYASLVSEN